jgi:hypothetical protein
LLRAGRIGVACLCLGCLLPGPSRAHELNLALLTCEKFQLQIENPTLASQIEQPFDLDAVNTVMWLFGFAVGKSGATVMYGSALQVFGNALDAVCKDHPSASLQDAVTLVNLKSPNPMDLTTLNCSTFETRHAELTRTDPESANTIMTWLLGYAVARAGGHMLDDAAAADFAAALAARCTAHPQASLFDTLTAVKFPKLRK